MKLDNRWIKDTGTLVYVYRVKHFESMVWKWFREVGETTTELGTFRMGSEANLLHFEPSSGITFDTFDLDAISQAKVHVLTSQFSSATPR